MTVRDGETTHSDADEMPTPWATFIRLGHIESDVRSLRQTMTDQVLPQITNQADEIRQLRSRFVYALTIIGSSLGAVVYLVMNGGPPT